MTSQGPGRIRRWCRIVIGVIALVTLAGAVTGCGTSQGTRGPLGVHYTDHKLGDCQKKANILLYRGRNNSDTRDWLPLKATHRTNTESNGTLINGEEFITTSTSADDQVVNWLVTDQDNAIACQAGMLVGTRTDILGTWRPVEVRGSWTEAKVGPGEKILGYWVLVWDPNKDEGQGILPGPAPS
jgi:hypothetical protein